MNTSTVTTASTVFIHKSAKGAITLSFADGDTNYTVFGEDIAKEAAFALSERVNPQVQVKGDRKYYMTKGKVSVTFRPTGTTVDETGRRSGTARIEAIGDAPNELDVTFGSLDFGAAQASNASKLA